jgi:hypothetical protein
MVCYFTTFDAIQCYARTYSTMQCHLKCTTTVKVLRCCHHGRTRGRRRQLDCSSASQHMCATTTTTTTPPPPPPPDPLPQAPTTVLRCAVSRCITALLDCSTWAWISSTPIRSSPAAAVCGHFWQCLHAQSVHTMPYPLVCPIPFRKPGIQNPPPKPHCTACPSGTTTPCLTRMHALYSWNAQNRRTSK